VCGATTLSAFGCLAFSQTPVLRAIGKYLRQARINYLEGEFYWNASVGQAADTVEAPASTEDDIYEAFDMLVDDSMAVDDSRFHRPRSAPFIPARWARTSDTGCAASFRSVNPSG